LTVSVLSIGDIKCGCSAFYFAGKDIDMGRSSVPAVIGRSVFVLGLFRRRCSHLNVCDVGKLTISFSPAQAGQAVESEPLLSIRPGSVLSPVVNSSVTDCLPNCSCSFWGPLERIAEGFNFVFSRSLLLLNLHARLCLAERLSS
jgi:hypothetical protein